MSTKIDFLLDIFSKQCEKGDYVGLSVKGVDTWKDIPLKYDSNFKKNLKQFFRKYPPEEYDLYFSPMPYSGPHRQIKNFIETKYLAQDIDEKDDLNTLNPAPSYIWESSPNKYQGLWELDRYIGKEEYDAINPVLAHRLGVDSCFDIPHVYRIPGTINHKYKNHPPVREPHHTKKIYKPKELKKLLGVNKPKKEKPIPGTDITERKIYAKYNLPKKVRDLLAITNLGGMDRSSTIWYIENRLIELGLEPSEIIYLVKNSAFNKYKGRKDEEKRLRKELDKILEGKIVGETDEGEELKLSSYQEVMSNLNTFPGWLVKGFWSRRSHGIVAGMPKSFKSTLVHDLAVSVAGGQPFLGKYPILEPGPVIIVQNENADYIIKDRTEKIIADRGLVGDIEILGKKTLSLEFPPELPLYFLNQKGVQLDSPVHQKQIEQLIQTVHPVLIIFDPLYLMFSGDLNSAKDLGPLLAWLLKLKNDYKTGVIVIHHYNKGNNSNQTRGGQKMLGSTVLHGWVESAWYVRREDEVGSSGEDEPEDKLTQPSLVTMQREFRSAGSYPDIDINIDMGETGDPYYGLEVSIHTEESGVVHDYKSDIINLLSNTGKPLTRVQISESLGISQEKSRKVIDKLLSSKDIISRKKGFTIPR